MWELNYDDLPSLYGFNSTYSTNTYSTASFDFQRRLYDMLSNAISGPNRNRAESRKHVRELHRRHVIRNRIRSLLRGVPMNERHSFTREELIELRKIKLTEERYDYWPISKSVTRRLRGLVKKQNGRTITVSLEHFLMIMPPTLNETEV